MKVLLFVVFAAFLATAQSLECYQCTNCENIGDRKPSACAAKPTVTPPTVETGTTDTATATVTTEEATTVITTTVATVPPPVVPKNLGNLNFPKLSDSNEILRNYRSIVTRERRAAGDDWYCYEAHYTVSDKNQVDRGCVNGGVANNKCPADLEAGLPGPVTGCTLCQNDGCNNGSGVAKLSFVALCIVLMTKLMA